MPAVSRVWEMSECDCRISVDVRFRPTGLVVVLSSDPPPISFSISSPKLVRPPEPKRRDASSEPDQKLLVDDPLICGVRASAWTSVPTRDPAMLPPTTQPLLPTGANKENCGERL